jgi:predicted Zn-dependent protease
MGAQKQLQEALVRKPDDAHARTFLALARAATGNCAEVMPDLESLWNMRDMVRDLRRLAGVGYVQCLTGLNRMEDATVVAGKLRAEFPQDPDVLYQTARVHMRAWNQVVQHMFVHTPSSWRVNQLSAEIFETQGKFAEAVAEYRKAIAKNPAAINLHYRLGRARLMESHSPEALAEAWKEFEAELALNPNDAVAEYQIGQIATATGDPEEALRRFQRAVAIDRDFVEALVALGKLHAGAKRAEDAIPLLERAVRLQPKHEAARYNLMLAYRNAGRADDALEQKTELDRIQQPPEGEFTDFLRRMGEKPPKQ